MNKKQTSTMGKAKRATVRVAQKTKRGIKAGYQTVANAAKGSSTDGRKQRGRASSKKMQRKKA